MAATQVTAALPVRSAVLKQCTGGLVVRWVATSESPLLYVFALVFASLRTLLPLQLYTQPDIVTLVFFLPISADSGEKACVSCYVPSRSAILSTPDSGRIVSLKTSQNEPSKYE
ncbi:hypothetical protein EJ02DRAFT_342778 [Clathrospora elynae]|uniref:Uncharacterized protein n=1 Tax=Clathrospora elynae TaxID=706981 RepID=A0A6A5SVD0_9PLEO|nr:hypothetical protein EJ02DRAFT_342778 [Clathrospora elynae]